MRWNVSDSGPNSFWALHVEITAGKDYKSGETIVVRLGLPHGYRTTWIECDKDIKFGSTIDFVLPYVLLKWDDVESAIVQTMYHSNEIGRTEIIRVYLVETS